MKTTKAVKAVKAMKAVKAVVTIDHVCFFKADLIEVAGACVVHVTGLFDLTGAETGPATHRFNNFPFAGYWNPAGGVFVVPVDQVMKI